MVTAVYACNQAYISQTLVSMISLVRSNPDAKIYLITDHVEKWAVQNLTDKMEKYQQQITIIDIMDILPDMQLDDKDRHPRTIYAKLFLGQAIEEDRILYLDSDVVVMDSLAPLFQRDMEHEYVAGVLMPYSTKMKARIGAFPGEPYICDGVVLMNLAKWRNDGKSKECQDYICENQGLPSMLSEGTLNFVCRGRIGVLEPKYNLMPSMIMNDLQQIRELFRADCYYDSPQLIMSAREHPAIIHFMNELYNRPWYQKSDHPYKEAYREIEDSLQEQYERPDIGLARSTKITVWMRRHLPFRVFAFIYHMKNNI